jgi:hypothetical protein
MSGERRAILISLTLEPCTSPSVVEKIAIGYGNVSYTSVLSNREEMTLSACCEVEWAETGEGQRTGNIEIDAQVRE